MTTTTKEAATNLRRMLTGAQLPALPQSAIRLLELSQDPENGPPEFAVAIEADPGLAGQVLRFVNSSYFGFAREISSVKLAITLVGVRTIKNFALWSAVFSLMPNPKCGPFDLKSLWQDSLRRGLLARNLGKRMGLKEAEDLFTAALLQDMAVPLLAREMNRDYQELLAERGDGRVRLSQLERERFGWTHADAGAIMARSWSLPEQFAGMIASHTQSAEELAASGAPIGHQLVALSSRLPSAHDGGWAELSTFLPCYQRLLGAAAPQPAEVLAVVDNELAEFAPVLKLPAPKQTLVELLNG